MSPAVKALIDILRLTKYSWMTLHVLEKRLATSGILGIGVEPKDILKRAIDDGVCTYDPEERRVYLAPKFMTAPLSLLLESDPRRRHLSSRLPICRIIWSAGMPAAARKQESDRILKSIPAGYFVARTKSSDLVVAYGESAFSLRKYVANMASQIVISVSNPPDIIHGI